MALIKCPKCGKEFSDRAACCPQCGTSKEEVQKRIAELEIIELTNKRKRNYIITSAALIGILVLFCTYAIYVNVTPITAKNEAELDAAIKNPFRIAKDSLTIRIPSGTKEIEERAFDKCYDYIITTIIIPNSVTSIGYRAFDGCCNLNSIIWEAENCEDFGSSDTAPFCNRRSQITSFTFGKNVKHIPAYLCSSMHNLRSVVLPNSVSSIGKSAFQYAHIRSINIPKTVRSINNSAFYGCELSSIYISDVAAWCNISFGDKYSNPLYYYVDSIYINGEEVIDLTIPYGVTSIGNYTFNRCSRLKSITIPNSVTSIGDKAFLECTSLDSLTIPNSVTSIGNMAFFACWNLTIKLPEKFRGKVDLSTCKKVIYY